MKRIILAESGFTLAAAYAHAPAAVSGLDGRCAAQAAARCAVKDVRPKMGARVGQRPWLADSYRDLWHAPAAERKKQPLPAQT